MTDEEIARRKEHWRIAQEEYKNGMALWAEAWRDLNRTRKPSLKRALHIIEDRIMMRTGISRSEAGVYVTDLGHMEVGM